MREALDSRPRRRRRAEISSRPSNARFVSRGRSTNHVTALHVQSCTRRHRRITERFLTCNSITSVRRPSPRNVRLASAPTTTRGDNVASVECPFLPPRPFDESDVRATRAILHTSASTNHEPFSHVRLDRARPRDSRVRRPRRSLRPLQPRPPCEPATCPRCCAGRPPSAPEPSAKLPEYGMTRGAT